MVKTYWNCEDLLETREPTSTLLLTICVPEFRDDASGMKAVLSTLSSILQIFQGPPEKLLELVRVSLSKFETLDWPCGITMPQIMEKIVMRFSWCLQRFVEDNIGVSWYSSHGGNYRSNVRIVGQTVDVLVRQQGVDVVKVIFHERVQGARSPDRRENMEGVHIIPQGRVSEILG